MKISFYLDVIFISSSSSAKLKGVVQLTIKLLTSLGFSPNFQKLNLSPSKIIDHLGFSWNSIDMSVSVPSEKLDKVRIQAQSILNRTPSIREVSSFLGRLVSLKSGFPYAPLYVLSQSAISIL